MQSDSFSKLDSATRRELILSSRFPDRAGIIYDKLNRLDLYHPHLTVDQLHSILAPTMVMAGDHDIIIDTHTLKLFHSLPNAELCIIPGATHSFLLDKPSLANGIIMEFLSSHFRKMN